MHFHVITLFPEMVEQAISVGVVGQALKDGRIQLTTLSPRVFTNDVHHSVDDRPYGGGDGMIMLAETLKASVDALRAGGAGPAAKVIHLSPRGVLLDDSMVRRLARELTSPPDSATMQEAGGASVRHRWSGGHLILLASRYGGVDQRFLNDFVDEEISVGDYVVSGGELPALVLMDALARHSKGVLGNESSIEAESFADGLLEFPQFTRPREWQGAETPAALLSGHHEKIDRWKAEMSLLVTLDRRPDLLQGEGLGFVKVLGAPLSRRFLEGARQTLRSMTERDKKICGISVSDRLSSKLDAIILSTPEEDSKGRRSRERIER